jgi:hypothetical protein
MSRKRKNWHPLETLGHWRGMTPRQTWQWLITRGWCSDLCVDLYEIASADVDRILTAAGKRQLFPPSIAELCARPDCTPILDL